MIDTRPVNYKAPLGHENTFPEQSGYGRVKNICMSH